MRAQSLSTSAIAKSLGITHRNVTALEDSARKVARKARPVEDASRTIPIPVELLDKLEPHARRRGISVNLFVRKIIGQIVDDEIVDAVMDDAEARSV